MSPQEAKENIGKPVMSRDAGNKLIPSVRIPHGPYILKHVTKSGRAIIVKPSGDISVPPNLLSAPESRTNSNHSQT